MRFEGESERFEGALSAVSQGRPTHRREAGIGAVLIRQPPEAVPYPTCQAW